MHPSRTPHASLLAAALLSLHAGAAETPEPAPAAPAAPLAETLEPAPGPALATDLPAPTTPASTPSDNVTINLIQRLVAKGVLDRAEADEMIRQAEADAAAVAAARQDIAALPAEPSADEEMTISYIPEVVREQMRDQIQQELLAHAREEKWSEKHSPEWTERLRPFGDIRLRSENIFLPTTVTTTDANGNLVIVEGNDNTGVFPNFNAINTGSPFDTSGTLFSPQHNVDQDRHRTRLRARAGMEITLGEGFDAGLRLATGETSSPVSPNQSLGATGGNFSKYAIWLDRAFLSYDAGPGDGEELTFLLGRFDNPFMSTDILWDEDIGFDGLALRGRASIRDSLSTFFAAGYFPVYNTDLNFASNQPAKFDSTDKWLAAAQIGLEWKINEQLSARFGLAYYDYDAIEGKLSTPFIPLTDKDAGDTDTTRPSYAQRGNTYMALRDIDNSTAANDFGNKYQYQYYGLATPFENLAATGRLDYDPSDTLRLTLLGEYIQNIAFDASAIDQIAVNNRGDSPGNGKPGAYEGGDSAWQVSFLIGNPALEKLWDWQAGVGYRHVESDAVVDAFADSDFGGGGTNVKGFTLGANLALSHAVRFGLHWMSSDEIAGPPLSSDTLQLDLNARF